MTALACANAMPVLREVRLYGPLRAQFGRSHWLAVDSPAEAVRALCALLKGFREAITGHKGPGYRLLVGEGRGADWRDPQTLGVSAGSATTIRLVPVLHGAKRQGWGQVILGVVILVAAYFGYGTPQTVQLGMGLILGGAVALLSPQPGGTGSKAKEEVRSQSINGPVNVTSAGGPVPLIIGRVLVGSVTISAGLSTDDFTPPATSLPAAPDRPADEPDTWIEPAGGI